MLEALSRRLELPMNRTLGKAVETLYETYQR